MNAMPLEKLLPTGVLPQDTLYIVDRNLRVVHVNEEWRRFAGANNGSRLLGEGWNNHLLANFSGSEKLRWTAIYKALVDGRLAAHEENFLCPSPIERRTYKLRIIPHRDDTGAVAYLVHHAVRIDAMREPPSSLRQRLEEIDTDTRSAMAAYREHVMERRLTSPRFETARHLQPLDEVGGDLIWHHTYESGHTDVVLADAMGHGLEAARLATKIVLLLDFITQTHQGVSGNISRLNELLMKSQNRPGEMVFATGLYLRMIPEVDALIISSFGHSGPIFSKAGHLSLEGGPPVGLMETSETWPEQRLSISTHGQRFLVFTDGVTEQFNPQGEMFGEAALEREFHHTLELPLHGMLLQLRMRVEEFRGPALVKDDQTLLGLEHES